MGNQSQIDEIKSKIDIVSLVNEYVPLKKAGRNYKALCPFHNEKTPSFMVNPDRQIFKCFGCGEGGDAFTFYQRMEGVEFGETLKFLASRTGVKLKEYAPTKLEQKKEVFLRANEIASKLYHHLLTKHPSGKKALEYLKARGVKQKAIADFQLGYAPEREKLLLDYLTKKEFSIQDVVSSGLAFVSGNKPRDQFRGRVMFPIVDTQGRVIAFSGRALGNIEPKYLNSPETPIFSKSKALYGIDHAKQPMKKETSAVLVEGNLDVISSHQIGVTNVVAPLGTAVTEFQVEIIKRWAENLLFAFDTDLAGDAAAKRGIEIAENAGMNIRVVQLHQGKDPDEIIRKDPLAWKKAIKEAVPIYDFFIDSAISKYGTSGAEAKKKVAAATLTDIAKINDEISKAHYLQTLSSKLGVEEAVLRTAMNKYQSKEPTTVDIKEVLEKPLSEKGKILIEKYLLALILQGGQFPQEAEDKILDEAQLRELFAKIKQFINSEGRLKVKVLIKTIPTALLPTFDELLLLDINEEILEDEEKLQREINYCTSRLKELNLRTKLKDLSLAIKQAESIGNQSKVISLSEQFRDLSKVLNSLEMK
ncbi:MAG: DNA primase [Candidatus Woykebacteria bacterium RBG_16_43_9]|uniref:DNA primase n=1 Tax=Candidatus Woykebacteria bacterium RBG_16_43_9 TaxID=1802596 RepID=A0A1G1WBI9_9BACT|nr:MAG: DNA primase [Candidatus Woykebacteria bacterium RBG_16_43_9]